MTPERIEDMDLEEETRNALELVKKGVPIVHAADASDAHVVEVVKAADRAGLLETGQGGLESMYARLAMKSGLRLEGLIDDPTQKLSLQQLGVVSGISSDKFTKLQELTIKRNQKSEDRLGTAAALLARLHEQGGGRITVTAAVESDDDTRTIEVET